MSWVDKPPSPSMITRAHQYLQLHLRVFVKGLKLKCIIHHTYTPVLLTCLLKCIILHTCPYHNASSRIITYMNDDVSYCTSCSNISYMRTCTHHTCTPVLIITHHHVSFCTPVLLKCVIHMHTCTYHTSYMHTCDGGIHTHTHL